MANLFFLSCINIKKYPDLPDIGIFYTAIINNDIDTVKYYIKNYKYMPNVMLGSGPLGVGNEQPLSPIMMAAAHNKEGTEILDLLIKEGGNLNYVVNETGDNAIIIASRHNNPKALQFLIEKGMDVNSRDINGSSCLFAAVALKAWDTLRILLENGANVNIKSNINDWTVYHIIPWLEDLTAEKRQEIFSLLMQYDDTFFDEPDVSGYTPFAFALTFGQYEMIDFFLEHGALVSKALNCVNEELRSILHPDNKDYLVKLLNKCTGPLNGKDENGHTLLMLGLLGTNIPEIEYEIYKMLIEKSEIDQENNGGATAFMLAVAMNRLDIARLLISMGADKYHKDIIGQNAIEWHRIFQKSFGNPVNPEIYSLY
jgi:ankyrin repeat protein